MWTFPCSSTTCPTKKDTRCFSTEDASGSTSQAAAVIEGMESGARAFLIDEDTSATNFMVRDDLMQKIISRSKEPITPFIERARDLYEKAGISTIMVAGSSGAYFYIADTIIQMDCYVPIDITEKTKAYCAGYGAEPIRKAEGFQIPAPGRRLNAARGAAALGNGASRPRTEAEGCGLRADAATARMDALGGRTRWTDRTGAFGGGRGDGQNGRFGGGRSDSQDGHLGGGREGRRDDRIKVKVYGKDSLQVGKEPVDLRFVEQLIDSEQTNALAQILRYCVEHQLLERYDLSTVISMVQKELEKGGLPAHQRFLLRCHGTVYAQDPGNLCLLKPLPRLDPALRSCHIRCP